VQIDRKTRDLVRAALKEDLGSAGDISTEHFLPGGKGYKARLLAKEEGIICGTAIASEVFRQACPPRRHRLMWQVKDGQRVRPGVTLARIEGTREILTAERTALNFLQHLSGIATLTRAYVDRTRGTKARIYDTRKTLPGWRELEKYAVRTGGGQNHRMGLYDMALLKDNHLQGWKEDPLEVVEQRLLRFRKKHPGIRVEIEAQDADEVRLASALGADLIMLDNMGVPALRALIRRIRKDAPDTEIEISGGVDLETVERLARLDPDRISVGRLTHSAPALDISMKLAGGA